VDKLRHTRSVAYLVELVLLNKHQISGGGAKLHCYENFSGCKMTCLQIIHSTSYLVWETSSLQIDWQWVGLSANNLVSYSNVVFRVCAWATKICTVILGLLVSSRSPLHESGTLCRWTFAHPVLYLHSSVSWKLSFSREASLTKFVNFRYICKVASQLWLMPP